MIKRELVSLLSRVLVLSIALFSAGCAATYRPLNPPSVNYNSHDLQDGVGLSYRYDVLREAGNRKYARKEEKSGVRLLAVKLTNNTDTVINVGRDVLFYSGPKQLLPLDPYSVKSAIGQSVPGYLPYLLLTLLNVSVMNGTSVSSYPVGLVIGPGITGINMGTAGGANKNLLAELNKYNIIGRDIQRGETVYGIIGLRDRGYASITLGLRN